MNRQLSSVLLLAGLYLSGGFATVQAEALPEGPFTQTLDKMLQDERLVSYNIRSLTDEDITVELTYSGDHQYSDAELEPFNNGVCYALLETAVKTGLMPFTGGTDITCQAIQREGTRASGGDLGVSRYERQNDDFVYHGTR